jgi:enoyl-[acyl-carrier-protein] reductase (NADH)
VIDVSSLAPLKGSKALVTGIANDQSIAWGCAKAFRAFGADLAVTYLNDKARPHVEPLAKEVAASIFMPLDLQAPLKTRAASGITEFETLLQRAQAKAPTRSLVSIDDVGVAVAFLETSAAKLITGETLYIDGGYHIID